MRAFTPIKGSRLSAPGWSFTIVSGVALIPQNPTRSQKVNSFDNFYLFFYLFSESLISLGHNIGFDLDIGHYIAGSKGKSPIPVLQKDHLPIVSPHLKDRTADGGNVPWGNHLI